MSSDERWMRRALELAEKGRGRVSPNPMVGAVLVKGGRLVGEGFHHRYGQAHAEVKAIKRAGGRARGSTLYVTLEPCAHWGKTPPCADAVVRAGTKRVVAAMKDPNPLVSGKGFEILRKAGITVSSGVLEDEARHLNRAFIMRMKFGRPFVTLKVAASLDGRSATVTGESKWITGEKARREGHRLRAQVDAIAVGANTILKDNPSLTSHGAGRNPQRIVFAGRCPIPRTSQVFNGAAETRILKNVRGPQALRIMLKELARDGIAHLLVEGGRTLQQSFLEAGVVDEVVWFIAPMIIGQLKKLKDAVVLKNVKFDSVGRDFCLRGDAG